MEYEVELLNDRQYPVDIKALRHAAEAVLVMERPGTPCGLTIVVTDDEDIAGYNLQFRGVDAPTDVLSFPADAPPVAIPDELPYLGDLIIAFPYASAQASREGHALMDSLSLLVVHGTLHLLGYDHDTPEHRAAMWSVQEKALRNLGISPDIVPALEQRADSDHGTS